MTDAERLNEINIVLNLFEDDATIEMDVVKIMARNTLRAIKESMLIRMGEECAEEYESVYKHLHGFRGANIGQGILRYNQRERVSLEKQQRKKQMNDIVCSCSVCDEPIYESQLDGETVDENRVYKCGELQYIELFHATCADEYNRSIRRGI